MKVVLGKFARSGIEACLGCDVASGVREALRHYVGRRETGRFTASPDFLHRERRALDEHDRDGLELFVAPEIQATLEREAGQSAGLTVDRLAEHAVLLYLADLDRAGAIESVAGSPRLL